MSLCAAESTETSHDQPAVGSHFPYTLRLSVLLESFWTFCVVAWDHSLWSKL